MGSESGSLSGATRPRKVAFSREQKRKKEPAKNALALYCA
jgi:hypothetical protein